MGQQHSFESNKAGWRGPLAALRLWGVTLGDIGTEESIDSPTKGTAPESANADNVRK